METNKRRRSTYLRWNDQSLLQTQLRLKYINFLLFVSRDRYVIFSMERFNTIYGVFDKESPQTAVIPEKLVKHPVCTVVCTYITYWHFLRSKQVYWKKTFETKAIKHSLMCIVLKFHWNPFWNEDVMVIFVSVRTRIYRVVPFIVNIFWKHYNFFVSLWKYLNFWYVTYWRLIYDCYFINFFKILTLSGQKIQICKRTLIFLPISTRPQWICKFLCRILLRKNFKF